MQRTWGTWYTSHHPTSKRQNLEVGWVQKAPLASSVPSLNTPGSPAIRLSCMARGCLCCPEAVRVGRLRLRQGAHLLGRDGFQNHLREACHFTQSQLQASSNTFWDAYSYPEKRHRGNSKDEIRETIYHQKYKDRHLSTKAHGHR